MAVKQLAFQEDARYALLAGVENIAYGWSLVMCTAAWAFATECRWSAMPCAREASFRRRDFASLPMRVHRRV